VHAFDGQTDGHTRESNRVRCALKRKSGDKGAGRSLYAYALCSGSYIKVVGSSQGQGHRSTDACLCILFRLKLKLKKMFETSRQTCCSSSNYANLLQCFNVECHTVKNVRKIDSVAQSKVSELDSSFIRPLIGNTRCTGHFAALLWQILQTGLNVNSLLHTYVAFLRNVTSPSHDALLYRI